MSTFTIYCCRLDNEAYVGATNRPLARRQSEHKCSKTGAHDIAMRGGTYQVLETGTFTDTAARDARERHWINKMRDDGVQLTNQVRPGGLGLFGGDKSAFLRERVPCCDCGKMISRRNLARHQNHYCLQVTTENTITPVVTVESEHEPVTL